MKLLIILFSAIIYLSGQTVKPDTSGVPEFSVDEVIIYGENDRSKEKIPFGSPESALKNLSGIHLISRGPLGMEPLINGFGDGAVSVTVDGMKIHGACVDKMDPVSSYIEPENLGKISTLTGHTGSATAGGINFVTLKPDFSTPLSVMSDNFYESNGSGTKTGTVVNYASGDFALRSSFTWRRFSDYYAGKNVYIQNSSFTKMNYKADASYRIFDENIITLSYLGDDASDVGYPALIMDARSAKAAVTSITIAGDTWSALPGNNSLKLYYNRVNHLMDDYDRPLSEINSRIVMPGMYMPMTGSFETAGILFGTVISNNASVFSVNLGLSRQSSFADMKMISTNPGTPEMYLVNIGDAEEESGVLSFSYNTEIADDIYTTITGGVEQSFRELRREDAAALNTIYEPDFTPTAGYLLPSLSAEARYIYSSELTAGLQISYNTRAPLFTESYGYFLFNPMDNAFYAGNSRLKKEQSMRFSFETVRSFDHLDLTLKAFHLRFYGFIAGEFLSDDRFMIASIPFKQYINAGEAYTNGITALAEYDYHSFDGALSVTWQEGYSAYFKDNLPFMSPVNAELAVRYSEENWYAKISAYGTLRQKKVSRALSNEKELPGYLLLNTEAAYTVSDQMLFYLTVENILDAYYVTRFTVNNFPGRGISIRSGVTLRFDF